MDYLEEYEARQRKRALNDLRLRWDDAYDISWDGSQFRAVRLDNGRVLADERADRLRERIINDYSGNPVSRVRDAMTEEN